MFSKCPRAARCLRPNVFKMSRGRKVSEAKCFQNVWSRNVSEAKCPCDIWPRALTVTRMSDHRSQRGWDRWIEERRPLVQLAPRHAKWYPPLSGVRLAQLRHDIMLQIARVPNRQPTDRRIQKKRESSEQGLS